MINLTQIIYVLTGIYLILLTYSTIEDLRKTYIDDRVIYILFFVSLVIGILRCFSEKTLLPLILGILSLNFGYLLFYFNLFGDADVFVLSSLFFVFNHEKILISMLIAVYFVTIYSLLRIGYINMRFNRKLVFFLIVMVVLLSVLLLNYFGLAFSLLALTITMILLKNYKNGALMLEKVETSKLLPLDVVLINNKRFIVFDDDYLNYSNKIPFLVKILMPISIILGNKATNDKNNIIRKEDIKEKYVYRQIPLPFFLFFLVAAYISFFFENPLELLIILLVRS